MPKSLLEMLPVGRGCDQFHLSLPLTGATPDYVAKGRGDVSALIWFDLKSSEAVVLMVCQLSGAALTQASAELLPFIYARHLGSRGIQWRHVKWLYCDLEGDWGEIATCCYDSGAIHLSFRTLGEGNYCSAAHAIKSRRFDIDARQERFITQALNARRRQVVAA